MEAPGNAGNETARFLIARSNARVAIVSSETVSYYDDDGDDKYEDGADVFCFIMFCVSLVGAMCVGEVGIFWFGIRKSSSNE